MKEHPDYKYRPRRKPKTLVKSQIPSTHQKHIHPSQQHHHHHSHLSSGKEQTHLHQQSHQQHQNTTQVQHLSPKYPFSSSLELTLGIPRTPTFPLVNHYQLSASPLDTTLALDLQARLQQMYGSLYPPWRYFGCPSAATTNGT